MTTLAAQLADELLQIKEELIIDAINHALGRTDWTLDEVKGRGSLVYFGPNECLFSFDERPMLELYMTLSFRVGHQSRRLLSKTNYRKLYDEIRQPDA